MIYIRQYHFTFMKFKTFVLGLLIPVYLLISCNNGEKDDNPETTESNNIEFIKEKNNDNPTFDSDSIFEKLQGEWKEIEYPFRRAHFKNSTVKFIEEGVVEEPTFQEFKISKDCPFEVNNRKNASSNDIFLVMAQARTCEIIKVPNDSLILSGFNVSTNSDYNIIYRKVDQQ